MTTLQERATAPIPTPEPEAESSRFLQGLRLALGIVTVALTMYFVADLFSPSGEAVWRDLVGAVTGVVFAALLLRGHHKVTDGKTYWHLAAGTLGMVLMISAAFMAFAPINASQLSGSATDAECGSVLVGRSLTNGWINVNLDVTSEECGRARFERTAFALLQLELGAGMIWIGRFALRRQPRRVLFLAGAIFILGGGVAAGWASAAVANANTHNEAFAPWFDRYEAQFIRLSEANTDVRTAVIDGNPEALLTACTAMQDIDDELASSVEAWPSRYEPKRDSVARIFDPAQG